METILRGIRNVVSLGPKNACLHPRSAWVQETLQRRYAGWVWRWSSTWLHPATPVVRRCVSLWSTARRARRWKSQRGLPERAMCLAQGGRGWQRGRARRAACRGVCRGVCCVASRARVLEPCSTTRVHLLYSGPMAGRHSHTWGDASEGGFCGEAGLRPPTPF